jgi:hypothetical protein
MVLATLSTRSVSVGRRRRGRQDPVDLHRLWPEHDPVDEASEEALAALQCERIESLDHGLAEALDRGLAGVRGIPGAQSGFRLGHPRLEAGPLPA